MTYYVLYNQSSGHIVDLSESGPVSVEPGQALKTFNEPIPNPINSKWNSVTLEYNIKPLDTWETRMVTVYQFLNKFTAQERVIIKTVAKTNVALQDYLDMVNQAQEIDLNDPTLYGGLMFFVSLGLLDEYRIAEILG